MWEKTKLKIRCSVLSVLLAPCLRAREMYVYRAACAGMLSRVAVLFRLRRSRTVQRTGSLEKILFWKFTFSIYFSLKWIYL